MIGWLHDCNNPTLITFYFQKDISINSEKLITELFELTLRQCLELNRFQIFCEEFIEIHFFLHASNLTIISRKYSIILYRCFVFSFLIVWKMESTYPFFAHSYFVHECFCNYTSFRVAVRHCLTFEVHTLVGTEEMKPEKISKLFQLTNVNSDVIAVTYRWTIVFLSWY